MANADAGAASSASAPPPTALEARPWVPGRGFVDAGSNRRLAVTGGRRVLLEGTDVKAAKVIDQAPTADLGQPSQIPDALGGGWVFLGPRTLTFAKTIDGPLVPISHDIDLFGTGVGFGVDRITIKGTTYVLSTGKPAPPVVPDAVDLFGLPTGQVAARTKSGDVFFSPAPGKAFTKVADKTDQFAYDGAGILLRTPTSERRLGLDGTITPVTNVTGPRMVGTNNMMAFHFPDLNKPPPTTDAERMVDVFSVMSTDGTVLRVEDHDLLVFDGQRGVVSSVQKDAFSGHENCNAIRGGNPVFVGCNDKGGMNLFRIEAGDHPVLEKTFHDTYAQDFGYTAADAPLTLAHRCDGSAAAGVFCIRHDDGSWLETAPLADPQQLLASAPFVVGIVSSKDGNAWSFGWQNGNGDLLVADGGAKTVRSISKADLPDWARTGLRWQSVTASHGRVTFLVPGDNPGIIVVTAGGKIEAHPLEGHMSASGADALLVTPDGKLRETTDAGVSWHDVASPPGGVDPHFVRCSQAGCAVGPWIRLGWSRAKPSGG